MELLIDPAIWVSFFTLLILELILGVDNVVFISILTGRLPAAQRPKARFWGLTLALVTRLALLATLSWMVAAKEPIFAVFDHPVSWRDIILLVGGLFLLVKSTHEIHAKLEGSEDENENTGKVGASFGGIIVQVALLDIVFSLDSVITAVGMVKSVYVMAAAIIVAIVITLIFAGAIAGFIDRHPTIKMLALSFLVLIGAALIADGLRYEIPKGYVYGPIAFSLLVELLNIRAHKAKTTPVTLHKQYSPAETENNQQTGQNDKMDSETH